MSNWMMESVLQDQMAWLNIALSSQKRMREIEQKVLEEEAWSENYVRLVLNFNWPDSEPFVRAHPRIILDRARNNKARWIEAEPIILQSEWADQYRRSFNV